MANDSLESFDSEAGLFSYSQILHLLKIEFSRARRYDYPLTCALFQIDRLDHLKDLYGYKIRDQIEERVISVVHQLSRSSDFLGKIGERMVVILPHSDAAGVSVLMGRVQERLREFDFEVDGRPVQVSLSVGIATYQDQNTLFFDAILKNAETALESVIQRGGNGILVYTPPARAIQRRPGGGGVQ
jgi:diguanylate cyclase (GGDEF)-like protein